MISFNQVYVMMSDKLIDDYPTVILRARDKYIYIGLYCFDDNAERMRINEVLKFLQSLEKKEDARIELVSDRENEILSHLILSEMRRWRRNNHDNRLRWLKYQ
ncbi:hypothetical protein V6M85_03080 [Sulfolobus tengchongensis]|uniref:Uncharacterized protein n=1 Tax=Sulfolobus tengchongensis TaxID=207809 RepID=A0AAX4L2G4_9CREN